jgi:hypothetical protein
MKKSKRELLIEDEKNERLGLFGKWEKDEKCCENGLRKDIFSQ